MADELVVEEAVPTDAGSGPEVPPEAAGEMPPGGPGEDAASPEQLPEEPYGAQFLRKLHEDFALLMMEYDAALGPLDNPAVQAYAQEVMKTLDKQILGGAEKLFKKTYKQLPPLVPDQSAEPGAEPGADGGEEVIEEEPADAPPDGAPAEEEVMVEEVPPEEDKDYSDAVDADSAPRRDAPAGAAMAGMYKNGKALPKSSDPSKYRTDPDTLDSLRDPEEQYTFLLGDEQAQREANHDDHLHLAGAREVLAAPDPETYAVGRTPGGKPRTQTGKDRVLQSLRDPNEPQLKKPHTRASVAESRLRKLPNTEQGMSEMLEGLKEPAKSLLHSISPLPGGKGFRVVESYGEKSRHVDLTVKGVNKYLAGFKGTGAKSLLEGVAKGLNAGKAVRFKSAMTCPKCNSTPCVCGEKAMPGTEKWEDYPLEGVNGHNPDVDPTNTESGTSPPWFTALLPEKQKLDEAFGELTNLAEATTTWDEMMRHKSFHYHKALQDAHLKCASGCGYKDMPDQGEDQGNMDPDAVKHLKSLAAASNFFKALALSKDFGDPHRREAKFHAGNVKELLKAMGMGPEPTPTDHAEATYAEPGEMGEKGLDDLAQEQEASAKALSDLAKTLAPANA